MLNGALCLLKAMTTLLTTFLLQCSKMALPIKMVNGYTEMMKMTNYNDGKIHGWNGGECPVHPMTTIKVFFRGIITTKSFMASHIVGWLHRNASDDIVAFQVVKENKEPLVVWANMYDNGFGYVYKSKEEANEAALHNIDQRAVKFIEVL